MINNNYNSEYVTIGIIDAENEVESAVDSNLVQQVQQQNLASDGDTNTTGPDGRSWADMVDDNYAVDFNCASGGKQTPIQIGKIPNDDYSGLLAAIRQRMGSIEKKCFTTYYLFDS